MKPEYIPFTNDLIELAIREDIGDGDHSSLACIPPDERGRMKLLVKQEGVLAGVEVAEMVLRRLDPDVAFDKRIEDGAHVRPAMSPFMSRDAWSRCCRPSAFCSTSCSSMSGVRRKPRAT